MSHPSLRQSNPNGENQWTVPGTSLLPIADDGTARLREPFDAVLTSLILEFLELRQLDLTPVEFGDGFLQFDGPG